MDDLAILASYAHPDDEQAVAGTLRACAEQGIRTGLIVATRGEVGEIAEPHLATPETLGAVREQEMRRAAEIIGIHSLYFLGYRDSGMKGTPENDNPQAFINADSGEVVGRIVNVVREFKPTIIVTFDASGGYGHPDHLAIHRWTTQAFHAAREAASREAGTAFAPRRLFYASVPRSMHDKMNRWMKDLNLHSPYANLPNDRFGLPDEQITSIVDVADYVALKRQSLNAHRTQLNPVGLLRRLPDDLYAEWRGTEHFALAAGEPFPPNADRADLFAGLR